MASNEAIVEQPKQKWAPQFLPNCVYPFLRPTVKLNHPNGSPNPMINNLHQLREAITLTIDTCSKLLQSFPSQNPFFQNILSFYQVRKGDRGNVKLLGGHNFAAVLPGDSVAGVVVANGILNFLNIYNTLLIVRLVLTWFPNTPPAIVSPLSTLCDPYLNIFRGIIPPLGGTLDLSPILAFLVLNAFTSTAAALPAELPPTGASGLATSQEKWMRRLRGSNMKSSSAN